MKTIIKLMPAVLITIFLSVQLEVTAQNIARTDIMLSNMDGKKVAYDELVQSSEQTMIVFWNSNNKKHLDYLDMLNDREIIIGIDDDVKIIAICTDRFHNYQHLRVLADSRMWDINLYVDVNGSFKRMNSISQENLRAASYEDGKQTADPEATSDMNHRNYFVQR